MDIREMHPSTSIDKTCSFWVGVQAEGRAKGRDAVFIADIVEGDRFEELISAIVAHPEGHIVLLEAFSHWMWYAEKVYPRVAYMGKDLYISTVPERVENLLRYREDFPAFKQAHLIVNVYGSRWVRGLRANDQISVGVPYDLATISLKEFVRSTPEDYSRDHT